MMVVLGSRDIHRLLKRGLCRGLCILDADHMAKVHGKGKHAGVDVPPPAESSESKIIPIGDYN